MIDRERQRIRRLDLPRSMHPGRRGGAPNQVLMRNPNVPGGMEWADQRITENQGAHMRHPGVAEPFRSTDVWDRVGTAGSGDPIEWLTPGVGTPWEDGVANRPNLEWRVDALGMIHIRGVVKKADSTNEAFGSPIFKFNTNYLPDGGGVFYVPTPTLAGGTRSISYVSVWGLAGSGFDGHVRFPWNYASISELDLGQITFLIEG